MPDSPVEYLRKCNLTPIDRFFPNPLTYMYVCMYSCIHYPLVENLIYLMNFRRPSQSFKKKIESGKYFY